MSGNINPTFDSFGVLYQKQINFQREVEEVSSEQKLPKDDPIKFQYHMTAMTEELGEVLKADKRWKTHRNSTYIPKEKLDELSDCFITLMNIAIWSGFTCGDIQDAIEKKIAENNLRLNK